MDRASSHSNNHVAFSSTISLYQEHKENGGLGPWVEDAPEFTPSISDFICDVELSAQKTLDEIELAYFNKVIKTGVLVVSENEGSDFDNELHAYLRNRSDSERIRLANTDLSVRAKLGAHFIKAGIYPLTTYLTPTNVG